jgi:hypothetical protein
MADPCRAIGIERPLGAKSTYSADLSTKSSQEPVLYACYRTTNTGTLPSARTSDVWLPNHSLLRPRRP